MKYKILPITKVARGVTVYQIQAIKSFADVTAGDLGGFIEVEDCLSQDGDCWVYPDGIVLERARVYDDAKLIKGLLFGNGRLYLNGRMNWSGQDAGCFGDGRHGAHPVS